jgi:hypothetical protein
MASRGRSCRQALRDEGQGRSLTCSGLSRTTGSGQAYASLPAVVKGQIPLFRLGESRHSGARSSMPDLRNRLVRRFLGTSGHELAGEAPLNAYITALILNSAISLRQVTVSDGPLLFLSLSCAYFAVFRQRTRLPGASSSQCSTCSAVICVAQWVLSTAICWMVQNVLSSSGSSVVRLKSPQLATPTSVGS